MDLLDGIGFVQAQGERGRALGKERRLNMLAGQAYGAAPMQRPEILQQAVATDADAGLALGRALDSDEDRRNQTMTNMARTLVAAPKQARPGLYQQMRPALQRFGLSQLPEAYDDTTASVIDGAADAIVQASLGAAGSPSGYRQFQLMTAGMKPEDVMKAKRIELGLDPRAITAAAKTLKITGADGRERVATFDPTTQSYLVFDEATNLMRPLGQGDTVVGETAPAGVTTDVGQVAPTGTVSLEGATPQQNEQIAAVARLMTQQGMSPEQVDAFVASQNAGLQKAQRAAAAPTGSAPASFGVSRAPEEQAALTTAAQEQAKINAEISAYDRMTELESDRARRVAEGKAAGETQAQKVAALPQTVAAADETISLLDRVLNHPGRGAATGLSSANPLNRVPGTPAYDFNVLLDQIKGQAFLQAFQSLRGGGAITEREGQAATNAIARLNAAQSEGEFVSAIQDLRRIVGAGRQRAVEGVGRDAQGAGSSAPAGRQQQVMQALNDARDAIKRGAPREAVKQRLIELGYLKSAERL